MSFLSNMLKRELVKKEYSKSYSYYYRSLKVKMSIEEATASRRSIREYEKKPLTLEQLAQLLWAAQGITDVRRGFRTTPSAGATYPLEVYVVVGSNGVIGLEAGIYHYDPQAHVLKLLKYGDFRNELCLACLGQPWVKQAPIDIVIVAIYERTTLRYGDRGIRYVRMEVGHVGQNTYPQATALGLGTIVIGAFYDDKVREILRLSEKEYPMYVIPVGYPKWRHKLSIDELREYYEIYRRRYRG